MYPPMEMDNGTYYLKPMNCPMHCLIFRSRQRSYRELPLRLFELGTVYRYERAGTLHGLMRIRGFTQDDSHIFCTEDQLQDEIKSLLDFVISVLKAFGFTDFQAYLSTKDPEKFVGRDEIWDEGDRARCATRSSRTACAYGVKEGDAAFYGPKIDIDVRDAIGRRWQLSTIQCDFNLPERFELEYVGADNGRHRPIMLHRALFGSIERFFGVLVEHYAGAFPTWLAPVQVRVLPGRHRPRGVRRAGRRPSCVRPGLRVDVVEATDQLGKRIRTAKLEKLPYVLVVGDDDVANGTLGVNPRGGEVERDVPLDEFIERLPRRRRGGRGPAVGSMTFEQLWNGWRAAYVQSDGAAGASIPTTTAASSPGSSRAGCPTTRPTSSIGASGCFAILNAFPYSVGPRADAAVPGGRRPRGPGRRARRPSCGPTTTDCVRAVKAAYRPQGINVGHQPGQGGRRERQPAPPRPRRAPLDG